MNNLFSTTLTREEKESLETLFWLLAMIVAYAMAYNI